MDPKIFFETSQTSGKSVSDSAADKSGQAAKQAGIAFKEAFNAVNTGEKVDQKATTSAGNPYPKANANPERPYYTVNTHAADWDLRGQVVESDQPIGYGKSLPHIQETGNVDPPDNMLGSDLTFDSEALVSGTEPETNAQRWVAETAELLSGESKEATQGASDSQPPSSESSTAKAQIHSPNTYSPHAEFVSQFVDGKTDEGSVVRVKGLQDSIEIALPNGPASVSEVAEFARLQSLPDNFKRQVLSGFKEEALPASNDLLLAEQGGFNQIGKLAKSTIFIDQLASVLAPKSEWNPSIQQPVEIDRSEVATLIKRTLSTIDGFMTTGNVAKYELSNEAIQIRGAVIDAIDADDAIKLSDFDVTKLAILLEPKFFSAVSPSGEVAVKTRPQMEAIRAAQITGDSSFWALNDNGDLTTNKAQFDAGYRFGVLPAATGNPVRPHQIELESSMIAAQKMVGRNPNLQSSDPDKFKNLGIEAPTREKTFTSTDALNLRNFANIRGADDASATRPLSSSPAVAPFSHESQSLTAATPLTNSVSYQHGLNYFAANGAGYPLVSRSTNSDGFRTTQYQPSLHAGRDAGALSERFTQALTERLVQNVKTGNFNLRFNVHPRELGVVDISMEVRDGRLDAQISSTNPVTRDLLSESLPRLRDALQAGGLQLSNLEVNDNARDNQRRGLMSSHDHEDSAVDLNETASNIHLQVEDLILDADSVDYLA